MDYLGRSLHDLAQLVGGQLSLKTVLMLGDQVRPPIGVDPIHGSNGLLNFGLFVPLISCPIGLP